MKNRRPLLLCESGKSLTKKFSWKVARFLAEGNGSPRRGTGWRNINQFLIDELAKAQL